MPRQLIIGKNAPKIGTPPAIILINPKFPRNVGTIQRAASCWGINQVWFTGNRVPIEGSKKDRLPREERMKGYGDVDVINYDYPFDQFKNAVPVAIEVRDNSESLADFEHPENAVYVFGPEDGGLTRVTLQHCHRFVVIPTRHCLNLSAAVNVVLYDRILKRYLNGEDDVPSLAEHRGFVNAEEG